MPDFTWTPSYEPTESSEPRVRKFKANTGYEQRRRYGINADLKKWSLAFANCDDTEREEILGFLEARGGYEEFDWITPKGYTGKHVCDEWQARLTSCGRTTITTVFRQVGTP